MTTFKTCVIRLFNKNYEIKCPDNEAENLQMAAQRLHEELTSNKKKFANLEDFHNLLLASLHLTYELINCQKQQEQQRQQVTQFINTLENKINQVVNGDPEMIPQTD